MIDKQRKFNRWQTFSLGSLCEAIFDGPHATPEKTEAGPVYLGISNLTNGRIDLSDTEYLSEEDFVKWTRRVTPEPNDLVFSYETRLGEAALIPNGLRCCLGRRMGLLRFDTTKVDPQFMLYAYLGPEFQQTIRERTIHGSTVDRIPLIQLPDFPITIPDLATQRRIADILSALDDKIELNRQTNATLEAIAQAIFKQWFADFNYPGATGELVDSELGLIPAGWRVGKLDDVLVLQRGFDLPSDKRISGEYPILAASGPSGTHNEFMANGPGVTTGRSGVLGKVFYVHENFWPLNTSLWVKEFKNSSPLYAFHLLQGIDFNSYNAGSAVPTLNRNHVHSLPALLPPMKVIHAFDEIINPLMKRQKVNRVVPF